MSRLAGAMGIDVRVFKADWNAHGKSAGPRRNEQMVQFLKQHLKDGGRVIGVMAPGGRGTADMMSRCEQAGIEVIPLHKVMK